MKYQAKLPKHNHNVSQTHPLKEFATLFVGVSAVVVGIYFILGLCVDWAVDHIPDDFDEQAFFSTQGALPNESSDQALQALANDLKQCAGIKAPVSVASASSDDVNAFALPGKHIVFNQGLLDAVQGDMGLAFVMAHELAHIKHRDHLRGLGRGVVLGVVSALLTGSNSGLTEVMMPASTIGDSHYSRQREHAADIAALNTLYCRYGNVEGAAELFEYLAAEHNSNIPFSHYVASHPDTLQRIQTVQRFRVNQ